MACVSSPMHACTQIETEKTPSSFNANVDASFPLHAHPSQTPAAAAAAAAASSSLAMDISQSHNASRPHATIDDTHVHALVPPLHASSHPPSVSSSSSLLFLHSSIVVAPVAPAAMPRTNVILRFHVL